MLTERAASLVQPPWTLIQVRNVFHIQRGLTRRQAQAIQAIGYGWSWSTALPYRPVHQLWSRESSMRIRLPRCRAWTGQRRRWSAVSSRNDLIDRDCSAQDSGVGLILSDAHRASMASRIQSQVTCRWSVGYGLTGSRRRRTMFLEIRHQRGRPDLDGETAGPNKR